MECVSRFCRVFDRLNAGESLVLLSDRDPVPLLCELQAQRPDLFEWTPRESSPGNYSVQIFRRKDGDRQGVKEFLHWDHQRLDMLLSEVEWRVNQRLYQAAAERFSYFRSGFEHHIDMEERFAFPAYEALPTADLAVTRQLRTEHAVLRRLMQQVGSALGHGEDTAQRVLADIAVLREIIGPHAVTEDTKLYPAIDRASKPERKALVHRMQEV